MNTGRIKQGYGIIQRDIMILPISIYSKGVYCLLVSYAGQKESCFPSLNTICTDLDIAKNTLIKSLKELIAWKLIIADKNKTKDGDFANNIYYPMYITDSVTVVQDVNNGGSPDEPRVVHDVNPKNNSSKNNLSNDKFSNDLFESAGIKITTAKKQKKEKDSAKKEKTLLADCPEITVDLLKKRIKAPIYTGANFDYYYEAALAWSDKGQKTAFDWVGTIRNFILNDYKRGKIILGEITQEQKLKGVEDALANWDDI